MFSNIQDKLKIWEEKKIKTYLKKKLEILFIYINQLLHDHVVKQLVFMIYFFVINVKPASI